MSAHQSLPIVSVGMPTYNNEKYLRESIRSVLSQSFANIEVIISNNASTDGSEEVIREFQADSRVRHVRQEKNVGAFANFQFVLNQARGTYFMWHAGDDLLRPTFIEELVLVLERHPSVVLAMCDVEVIDESGNRLRTETIDSVRLDSDSTATSNRDLFFRYPIANRNYCIYGLYRKQALDRVQMNFNDQVRYLSGAELPILAQVALMGRIATISSPLKRYRVHSESTHLTEVKSLNALDHSRNIWNVSAVLARIALTSNIDSLSKVRIAASVMSRGWAKAALLLLRLAAKTALLSVVSRERLRNL